MLTLRIARFHCSFFIMIITLIGIISTITLQAEEDTTLTVIAWNLESGHIDPDVISQELGEFDEVHIWGLSEIFEGHALHFEEGIEQDEDNNYESILGTTGYGDRLVIIYDADRLRLVTTEELFDLTLNNSVRAPLIAEFEDMLTGQHFLFSVNHLARGNRLGRHVQAEKLNEWGATQTLPIILAGDFNFDYEVDDSDNDEGYDNLTRDNVFTWVRPSILVRTQCSADDDAKLEEIPEDLACEYNSVLDFVFVGGDAQGWVSESAIIIRDGDFPDDITTSDHRPVQAQFIIEATTVTKEMLLERIDALESELADLRALVEQLP